MCGTVLQGSVLVLFIMYVNYLEFKFFLFMMYVNYSEFKFVDSTKTGCEILSKNDIEIFKMNYRNCSA